jgi:hypothetical protein
MMLRVDNGSNDIFTWLFVAATIALIGPLLASTAYRRYQRKRRRRLVDSPRKIQVARVEDNVPAADVCTSGHQRSRSRAYTGPDGRLLSICKRCGVRMRRKGPGDWEILPSSSASE